MPVFEFETPAGRFQIDAPDERTAIEAFRNMDAPPASGEASAAEREFRDFSSRATGDIGRAADVEERARRAEATDPLATNRGLKIPFSDEIAGAVAAPAGLFNGRGMGEEYQREMEAQQIARDRFDAANPKGAAALGALGALGSMGAGGAAATASRGAAALQGAKQGALGGALFGAAEGQGADRAVNAGVGAAIGGAVGGAAGAVAGPSARAAPTPNPRQDMVAAAERLGVPVPGVVAGSRPAQRVGKFLADQPFVGAPLEKGVSGSIAKQGQTLDDLAARAGNVGDRSTAGRQVRGSLENWIGPGSKAKVTPAYDAVDALVDPAVTAPLRQTAKVAAEIGARRQAAGLPPGTAIAQLDDALARPGGLTYEGVKTLRTRIGEQVDTGILPPEMSKGELSRIYGALSDDLRSTVQTAGGGKALSAFERANQMARGAAKRRETLAKVIGAKSDEQVYETMVGMARTGGRENNRVLMQAMRSLDPATRADLSATAIARMGRDVEGAFSPTRFVTDYAKMTPNGKRALFGPLANDLDDLAKVSGAFKDFEKMGNPSGSGRYAGMLGAGAGLTVDPVSTIGAVAGGRVVASLLARPASVQGMTRWANAYQAAVTRPSEASARLFRSASTGLASMIAREMGQSGAAADIEAKLLAAISRSAPSSTTQPAPAP